MCELSLKCSRQNNEIKLKILFNHIFPLSIQLLLGFFGRNDAKAETPVFWPPHAKSWLIGKDCDAGMDWGQEEKGTTEDELAGWHHWLDGRESEWTLGVGDGQGGLACCDSWVTKSWTRMSDWTELMLSFFSQISWTRWCANFERNQHILTLSSF